MNYEFEQKSTEEISLKVLSIRRNNELVYKFLAGLPAPTSKKESVNAHIPFESNYYTAFIDAGMFKPESRITSPMKSKEIETIPKRPKSQLNRPRVSIRNKSSHNLTSEGDKLSLVSNYQLKKPPTYKAYRLKLQDQSIERRDAHDQQDDGRWHEIRAAADKLSWPSMMASKTLKFRPRSKEVFREISNINYLNYERQDSKEYARRKDDLKFKSHRDRIVKKFEIISDNDIH